MTLLAGVPSLGREVAERPGPLLVAVDLDGTIARIAPRPELVRLERGAVGALRALVRAGAHVAIVSGRAVADLLRFPLPDEAYLVGSHGLEQVPGPPLVLDDEERHRLSALHLLARRAAARADGCWIETKPAGLAFHRRAATDSRRARQTTAWLSEQADRLPGVWQRAGHEVLELSVRRAGKQVAVERLRTETGAATVVYVGDDRTDEDVFTALGRNDIGVKVGEGPTAATHRVARPADVVAFLDELAERL